MFDTLMVFRKDFFEKVNFEKNTQTTIKHAKLPSLQRVKMPFPSAADDILYIFILYYIYFSMKIRFDISCESSARQTIHMKCQYFYLGKKNK